jgi:hypothetical protein
VADGTQNFCTATRWGGPSSTTRLICPVPVARSAMAR